MGMHGIHAKAGSPRQQSTPTTVTPKALGIYKRMRRHERANGGPGGDEWWAMNAALADCFGLYPGMVCYEDPAWEYERPFQSDLDRFYELEQALRKHKPAKRGYQYKWER